MKKIIITILALQAMLRLKHWETITDPSHVALGDLYSGLTSKIDRLVESYQGYYGVIKELYQPGAQTLPIASLKEEIRATCNEITEYSKLPDSEGWVVNQLQEIQTELNLALYKLNRLDYKTGVESN